MELAILIIFVASHIVNISPVLPQVRYILLLDVLRVLVDALLDADEARGRLFRKVREDRPDVRLRQVERLRHILTPNRPFVFRESLDLILSGHGTCRGTINKVYIFCTGYNGTAQWYTSTIYQIINP
ncbi:hypothetical protein [Salinibacter phage 7_7]